MEKQSVITITSQVQELVSNSDAEVHARVIKHLVDRQIEERTALVIKGLDRRQSLLQEYERCKPDLHSRTATGDLEERFSDKQWRKRTSLQEKLTLLDKALEEALGQARYDALLEETS